MSRSSASGAGKSDGKDNGHEPPEGVKGWLTLPKAVRFSKVSARQILEWVERGDVRCEWFNGEKRFSDEDLALMLGKVDPDSYHLVDVLSEQTRALYKLTTEPTRLLLSLFSQETERLRARIDKLEERHFDTLKAYEDALSVQHERALEIEVAKRKQDRMDQGFKTFQAWLPRLAREAMGRVKVQKVIESLGDDQVAFLESIDAITPEQAKLLKKIRDDAAKDTEQKKTFLAALGLEGDEKTEAKADGDAADDASPMDDADAGDGGEPTEGKADGSQEKDAVQSDSQPQDGGAEPTPRKRTHQASGARRRKGPSGGNGKGSADG